MTASERLKIEAASLTAGTGGSGTAVLRLYVCNVDRATVDVVDFSGQELEGSAIYVPHSPASLRRAPAT